MTENNEQWLLQGNCNLCRRKNYCNTTCKAHRNKINLGLTNSFKATMERKIGNDGAGVLLNVVATGAELMSGLEPES